MHAGLGPETLFLTVGGKLKIAGLNFCTRMGTEEETPMDAVTPNVKFNDYHMYPNLKFAAPEISQSTPRCSPQSDVFSVALIMYYLLALERGADPHLLGQYDKTSPSAHKAELNQLASKLGSKVNCYEPEVQDILRMALTAHAPQARGNLGHIVSRPWFQDPLLKTIRYLENIDYKEQTQKVQFLTGLEQVLDKFEKKLLVDKIMPLLM